MTTTFENPGKLDPRLITTFGASVKGPDSIGYFGTGLKYAIAVELAGSPDHCNKTIRGFVLDWRRLSLEKQPRKELTEREAFMLNHAIAFLERLGYSIRDYEIYCSQYLGTNTLGAAHEGKIYLSETVFHQGTKQLAMTILEEYFHLKYSLDDETRKFQTFLFDQIGTLGETLLKEYL